MAYIAATIDFDGTLDIAHTRPNLIAPFILSCVQSNCIRRSEMPHLSEASLGVI